MPDLALTEEQQEFQKLAREFAENELAPKAYECDQQAKAPEALLKQLWELGLATTLIPDQFGGLGLSLLESCVIAEEMAAGCSGIYGVVEANTLAQMIVLALGTDAHKKKLLQPLTESPIFAGVDVNLFASTEKKNDSLKLKDGKVLSGEAVVANGVNSDWFVVSPGGSPRQFFVVSKSSAGVECGATVFSVGRKALPLTSIRLNNVQIASDDIFQADQQMLKLLQDQAACLLASGSLGIACSAMKNAIQYSKERKTFGVPIAQHQAVGFMIADMAKDIEATRLLIYQACAIAGAEQTGLVSAAVARSFALDMAMRITTDAVQVYGGYGYSKEYPVEKLMRDAKSYQVYQGSSVDSKVEIGRQLVHQ
ncbi:MAG: acyl-CoA dehydrogenase family protein [Cyanobacteria bacterium SZAS LIN-5]|nr:acyl-CoA dehydrogenase family protein [Cyanobacteria bacterium SZAS LIN-5]